MWGYLLGSFVILWLLQIFLTMRQMKHYRLTLKAMSQRENGYLGVGVEKKKLGSGTVMIVVTNAEGVIEDCQVMNGVTVFAKFKKCNRFIGRHVSSVQDETWASSLAMATQKIKQQMNSAVST